MCLRLLEGGEGGARVRSLRKRADGQWRRTAGERAEDERSGGRGGGVCESNMKRRENTMWRRQANSTCGSRGALGLNTRDLGKHSGSYIGSRGALRAQYDTMRQQRYDTTTRRSKTGGKQYTSGRAKGRRKRGTRKQAAKSRKVVARGERGLQMSGVHEAIY
ncbi:hypothetical protein LXA43DRAFT_1069061 [Ganoderma leucocontextum]|nr:hypothetical protein LXA43DRAFT_1069061 [Ganoderma leucocontextum]